jgi:hypothetical protein
VRYLAYFDLDDIYWCLCVVPDQNGWCGIEYSKGNDAGEVLVRTPSPAACATQLAVFYRPLCRNGIQVSPLVP